MDGYLTSGFAGGMRGQGLLDHRPQRAVPGFVTPAIEMESVAQEEPVVGFALGVQKRRRQVRKKQA